MHPEIRRFIEEFEREAERKGQYRNRLGKSEILFLENVWGPAFQYRFEGLKAEYPFKDFKGGDRFIDFVYTQGGIRLIVEIDGFTTHARDISPGDFDDHLKRQNELALSGWMILRFSANQVDKRSMICQRQLKQSIGHWWSMAYGGFSVNETGVWTLRKRLTVELALRQNGTIRAIDISREFGIKERTAINWITRFVLEGTFEPIRPNKRIIGYRLVGYQQ